MRLPNEIIIALVTVACIIFLRLALYLTDSTLPFLLSIGPVYVFIAYLLARGGRRQSRREAAYWTVALLMVTLASFTASL